MDKEQIIDKVAEHIKVICPTYGYVNADNLFGANGATYQGWGLNLKGHNGLDYKVATGTMIFAPCNMEVNVQYEDKDKGYGNTIWGRSRESVVIGDREYKLEIILGHLDSFIEKSGDVVMGQPIAYSDNTGKYSTGPHLHFGTRVVVFNGNNWEALDYNNGYYGYTDPYKFFYKSFQKEPIRLFKGYNSNAFYWLGVDGRHHVIGDAEIVHKLIGSWNNLTWHNLKVDLPKSYSRLQFSTIEALYKVLTGVVKAFKS